MTRVQSESKHHSPASSLLSSLLSLVQMLYALSSLLALAQMPDFLALSLSRKSLCRLLFIPLSPPPTDEFRASEGNLSSHHALIRPKNFVVAKATSRWSHAMVCQTSHRTQLMNFATVEAASRWSCTVVHRMSHHALV
ncbi:hypothetical protein EUGRSUZ_L03027 [Eucalyptus grandis]|uniref:Uncharacterized protein n=1 Tax=Eucalyptus grandis TaxID=71139 RepID=A0AAD9T8G0_EUCGR|nr:hypothetical protein EUGRSUZ_L03027 [Eucalyptus grandis]